MKVSDYVVDLLIEKGVTDVFGMPGGVVLDFLDSVGKRSGEISARLNYNEQASAFAACGYAQASGKLAIAYATRGPGITNMITGIADAYCDSLSIIFITAHSHKSVLSKTNIRIESNQEFDTINMLSALTKYAVKIDAVENVRYEVEKACSLALSGRPGPILIDFLADVLRSDMCPNSQCPFIPNKLLRCNKAFEDLADCIKSSIQEFSRPIVLIGDGARQISGTTHMEELARNWKIPILTSRFSQDIISCSDYNFGFIGSHGLRYANFILSKCDLIISLGNRLAFDLNSKSFGRIAEQAKIIRVDIDESEFSKKIGNASNFVFDLQKIIPNLADMDIGFNDDENWLETCKYIRDAFYEYDTEFPVNLIADIISVICSNTVITSDVGNNEFWLSRAHALAQKTNRILNSKSFGTLGSSLPKAIGAYYSTGNKIICFTGDQGLQMNIQELQFVVKEKLPIAIVVMNNFSSGLIYNEQKKKFNSQFIGTTLDSGYSVPDFEKIANAYGLTYIRLDDKYDFASLYLFQNINHPILIEVVVDESVFGIPHLPVGYPMQKLAPEIDDELYGKIERL